MDHVEYAKKLPTATALTTGETEANNNKVNYPRHWRKRKDKKLIAEVSGISPLVSL